MNDLILRAKNGDELAFASLASRYQNMVFAYSLSKLGDYQLAEDAVQETFIAVFYGLENLGDEAAFPAWLRTIATRQCNRFLRRSSWQEQPLDRLAAQRSRKLELFMSQPFIVAEPYNGRPGAVVPRMETIKVTKGIIDGAYDHIQEHSFAFVRGLDEVLAKNDLEL